MTLQDLIIEYFKTVSPSANAQQITDELGARKDTVSAALRRLYSRGQLRRCGPGVYELAEKPDPGVWIVADAESLLVDAPKPFETEHGAQLLLNAVKAFIGENQDNMIWVENERFMERLLDAPKGWAVAVVTNKKDQLAEAKKLSAGRITLEWSGSKLSIGVDEGWLAETCSRF